VRSAYVILLGANLVYATSYVVSRVVLHDLPPALLALIRLVVGAAILVPIARALEPPPSAPPRRGDARRLMLMGAVGFAAAFALANAGLARSTATNAALLIIVEPISIMALSPLLLGERLTRRQTAGAALAVVGAVVVVLDGVPGLTRALAPHWRGDLLLVLAGLAYGAYTLIGRDVLARHRALGVTARSISWGAAFMVPLAVGEWAGGARAVLTAGAVAGALYLAVVITAFGYLVWNWALARVAAPQAAISLTVQPVGGVVLAAALLHEPLSAFTVAGGALVLAGLWLTASGRQ
jgi:drug/metabolite transporter (DMT)-like permease